MELEGLNRDYSISKKALDKSGKLITTLETLKTEIKTLKRKMEDIQIEIIRAKEDGESEKAKTLEASLKAPKAQLILKKEQLQKLEAVVRQNQIVVGKKMAEIAQDPVLKAHLKDTIGKKFSRQLTKIQKNKEEKVNQNETLVRIQEAAKKDPNVMYMLKEIEKYAKIAAKLQQVVANSKKPESDQKKEQDLLLSMQNSLSRKRGQLAKYFKGTISRDVIDKITSYESLEKEIKLNNKYISGLDKQIANYTTALENIGFLEPRNNSFSRADEGSRENDSVENNGISVSSEIDRENTEHPAPLPAPQPKWYQFATRFKNWVARLKSKPDVTEKQADEPEPQSKPEPEPEQKPISISEEQKIQFRDSMKYDIVKDYEEKLAADILKQAKHQNKQNDGMDRDD